MARGILHGPFDPDDGLGSSEPSRFTHRFKEKHMSVGTILLIVLILMLIGVIPTWPHSRNWGYWPSGGLGLVVIIIIVLLLMGRL
jgi:asparagine N-glycosylation enzyme membrane subunit Stt3